MTRWVKSKIINSKPLDGNGSCYVENGVTLMCQEPLADTIMECPCPYQANVKFNGSKAVFIDMYF